MIDTSVMIAALIADHEFHPSARPHLSPDTVISAIVLAETYAQLRRTFHQSAASASTLLRPWTSNEKLIAATDAKTVKSVFSRAVELDLGGNIHDALVAAVCKKNDAELVTLDRRQHTVALTSGVASTLLLTTT